MRTTVTLDDDVAKALEALRREEGLATSAVLNRLVRQGLAAPAASKPPFRQQTSAIGRPRIPLDNIGEALEILKDEAHT
jgi:hypothetical protein